MDFQGLFRRKKPSPAMFQAGRVGFAVGDIHGRADLLEPLIEKFEQLAGSEQREAGEPLLVFLGDYVDRGRESMRVIDLLLSGRPGGYERRFLRGNHEQSMLAFMEEPLANKAWLRYGGAETLLAYGVTPPSLLQSTDEEWLEACAAFKAGTPPEHMEFLNALERYVIAGDYAFVHAGVDPARTMEEQTDADLYWIRERFLDSRRRFSHRVVHGHTVVEQAVADDRRISIDTGAYMSGVLTAVRLEGADVSFLSAGAGAAA